MVEKLLKADTHAFVAKLVPMNAPLAVGLGVLFVVAAGLNDWRERGRVHQLYVFGGVALLLSGPLRIAVGHTETWHAFARMLVG